MTAGGAVPPAGRPGDATLTRTCDGPRAADPPGSPALSLLQPDLAAIGLLLFLLMQAAKEAAYRLALPHSPPQPVSDSVKDTQFLVAGTVALLAFVLAVGFSVALGRYEARRLAIAEEAAAIGTAMLQAAALPAPHDAAALALLAGYTESRIAFVTAPAGAEAVIAASEARRAALATALWQAARQPEPPPAPLAEALLAVFRLGGAQRATFEQRVSEASWLMLSAMPLLGGTGIGWHLGLLRRRSLVTSSVLFAMFALMITVILDLALARLGTQGDSVAPYAAVLQSLGELRAAAPR